MSDINERFLTTEEVATICRTHPETVRYWRHIGTGPASFKVGRRVLYAAEDVERWLAEARKDVSSRQEAESESITLDALAARLSVLEARFDALAVRP